MKYIYLYVNEITSNHSYNEGMKDDWYQVHLKDVINAIFYMSISFWEFNR